MTVENMTRLACQVLPITNKYFIGNPLLAPDRIEQFLREAQRSIKRGRTTQSETGGLRVIATDDEGGVEVYVRLGRLS